MRAWAASLATIALLAIGALGAQILNVNQHLKSRVGVQVRSLDSTTVPAMQQAIMDQAVTKAVAIQRSEPELVQQQTVALEAIASQVRGLQSATAVLTCEPQCRKYCEALNGDVWKECGKCETVAWAMCRPGKRQEQRAPSSSSESKPMANPNSWQQAVTDRALVATAVAMKTSGPAAAVAEPVKTAGSGPATRLVEAIRSTPALVQCPKVFIYNMSALRQHEPVLRRIGYGRRIGPSGKSTS